jgi:hypothetical protein
MTVFPAALIDHRLGEIVLLCKTDGDRAMISALQSFASMIWVMVSKRNAGGEFLYPATPNRQRDGFFWGGEWPADQRQEWAFIDAISEIGYAAVNLEYEILAEEQRRLVRRKFKQLARTIGETLPLLDKKNKSDLYMADVAQAAGSHHSAGIMAARAKRVMPGSEG